jgi:transcriptional regulator with XRE-family HTH domain
MSEPLPEPGDTTASRIRHARLSAGYSIVRLTQLSGVSVQSVSLAEHGHINVDPRTLRKYAAALNVTISFLGCYDDLPKETVGQRIRKARLSQGLLISELAALLEVDVKSIRYWENETRIPSERYLTIIQSKLNI